MRTASAFAHQEVGVGWVSDWKQDFWLGCVCTTRRCRCCLSIHLCVCMHRKTMFVNVGGKTHIATFSSLTLSSPAASLLRSSAATIAVAASSASVSPLPPPLSRLLPLPPPLPLLPLLAQQLLLLWQLLPPPPWLPPLPQSLPPLSLPTAALLYQIIAPHPPRPPHCCFPADQARAVVVRPKGRAPRDPPPCWRAAAARDG